MAFIQLCAYEFAEKYTCATMPSCELRKDKIQTLTKYFCIVFYVKIIYREYKLIPVPVATRATSRVKILIVLTAFEESQSISSTIDEIILK